MPHLLAWCLPLYSPSLSIGCFLRPQSTPALQRRSCNSEPNTLSGKVAMQCSWIGPRDFDSVGLPRPTKYRTETAAPMLQSAQNDLTDTARPMVPYQVAHMHTDTAGSTRQAAMMLSMPMVEIQSFPRGTPEEPHGRNAAEEMLYRSHSGKY
ncbi:hypothetical protein GQ53DRAFT_761025 [Thozetella sp. PMI_491]|nr:hypothetical protein GQ53DRAFT_761025 [Thozetella sp. PMI_491]